MLKLYRKQKEKSDLIIEGFKTRDFILLTGEVGVGKTYMGTYIAKKWLENFPLSNILIIVPKHVLSKWNSVIELSEINKDNIKITHTVKKDEIDNADFIIYDEIHEIKTKTKHFSDFVTTNKKLLGLTGTIIDKDINDMTNITNFFSNNGIKYNRYLDKRKSWSTKQAYIRLYIEPLLTVGISKADVDESLFGNDDAVLVNTKDYAIKMDDEESAFYAFISRRLANKQIAENSRLSILNGFLDRVPDVSPYIKKTSWETVESNNNTTKIANVNAYFVGEQLHNKSTKKDEILKELLNEYKNSTLIYTLNDNVAKRIANETSAIYVNAKSITAEEEINNLVKSNVVVLNINHILTGVDLHANNIIWYQTPLSLTQETQAVGRILRLSSSSDDKLIIYLYHENTMQEETIKKLQENHKLNNELISKKDKNIKISNIPFFENLKR